MSEKRHKINTALKRIWGPQNLELLLCSMEQRKPAWGFITFASEPSDKNVAKYSNRYSSGETTREGHADVCSGVHKYMCNTPYASQQEGNRS